MYCWNKYTAFSFVSNVKWSFLCNIFPGLINQGVGGILISLKNFPLSVFFCYICIL